MSAPSGKYGVAKAIATEKYDADIREDAIKQLMLSPLDDLIKEWNKIKKKALGGKKGGKIKTYAKGGGIRKPKY